VFSLFKALHPLCVAESTDVRRRCNRAPAGLPGNWNHLATNASNPIILQQLLYGRQVLRSNKQDGRTFAKSIIDMKEEPGCGYQRLDYRHVLVAKLRNRHERVVRPYCSHNPNSSRPDSHYGAHVTRVPILKRTGGFSHRGRVAVRIGRPAGLLSEGTPAYQVLSGEPGGGRQSRGKVPPPTLRPGSQDSGNERGGELCLCLAGHVLRGVGITTQFSIYRSGGTFPLMCRPPLVTGEGVPRTLSTVKLGKRRHRRRPEAAAQSRSPGSPRRDACFLQPDRPSIRVE
jgi:hypothetical protein